MNDPDYSTGDPDVGEVLRQFFVSLLSDGDAMFRYQTSGEGRTAVVMERVSGEGPAIEEAQRLLLEGTLPEIEEHIRAVTSTPHTIVMAIVWPPTGWPF